MDGSLAADFDVKLREVMEALSSAVNSEHLSRPMKREKSLTAKIDLLTMCGEKIFDYLTDQEKRVGPIKKGTDVGSNLLLLNGVLTGVLDGLRDAYADLQASHIDLATTLE